MLTVATVHPRDLTPSDIGAWRDLLAASPGLESPLLTPDFAQAVGRVRPDARVSLWRRNGRAVGVLAYHLRPGGLARPIGAPFSDYHALAAEADLDPSEALALAGLAAYRFTGLLDPRGVFFHAVTETRDAFVIRLEAGAGAYLEALRADNPKRAKNYRRLDGKLSRDVGELRVVADRDPAAFAALLNWKREQMARTGVHDVLGPAWAQTLMQSLFERQDEGFAGLMLNLYAGDRLVAGHFGVRSGAAFHPWIASTDPQAAIWSPGHLFLYRAIEAMPSLGLDTYDLGPSHDHYKRPYVLAPRSVGAGVITTDTVQGRAARRSEQAWILAGRLAHEKVGSLRRRLDSIAAAELTLGGRARGLALAVAARAMPRSAA